MSDNEYIDECESSDEGDFIFEDEDDFDFDLAPTKELTSEEKIERDLSNKIYANKDKIYLSDVTIRTIMNDIKEMDRSKICEHGIFYGELPDDFSHVNLYLRFDQSNKLGQQLKEFGDNAKNEMLIKMTNNGILKKEALIILEEDESYEFMDCLHVQVEFNDEYPNKAPFARIVKPKVKTVNQHFAVFGGALCFNFLSKFGVNPTQHFQDIFISVKPLMEMNLEVTDFKGQFTKQEAKEGYDRINNAHKRW